MNVRVEAVSYGAGVAISHRVAGVAYGGRREFVVAVGAETEVHSEAPIGLGCIPILVCFGERYKLEIRPGV